LHVFNEQPLADLMTIRSPDGTVTLSGPGVIVGGDTQAVRVPPRRLTVIGYPGAPTAEITGPQGKSSSHLREAADLVCDRRHDPGALRADQ